jgi:outer membrane protein assembly factor BamB
VKKQLRFFLLWSLLVAFSPAALNSVVAQSEWTNFRGDPQLRGTSEAIIPVRPSLLWSFKTGDAIKASPVVSEGIIVAGSVDGNVYGITLEGKMKWKINTGNGIESAALIRNGVAYIGNLDGKVFAIELQTGRTLWTYATEGQIMGAPNYWSGISTTGKGNTGSGGKVRAGDGGVVVIGSYDYFLHGIDAATGEGRWKYEADNFINGTPAIYEGVAVFGGCDGLLHQVNVQDGSLKKRQPVATYVAGSVAVDDWITFVGDYDGKFTCLDIRAGEERWSFKNSEAELPFIASPALGKKRVYIGNRDKYVYCFNRENGELIWSVNTLGRVDASPVLLGQQLLVATMRGDLMLLNASDGKITWTYELGSAVFGNPAVIDGYIIAGAQDGRIYCIGQK